MPLYDYECRKCDHQLTDVFQKVTEPPLKKCDGCHSDNLFRVITGGLHGFMVGSNTVGGVADRNTKLNKNKINEMEAKKRESQPQQERTLYDKHTTKSKKEINNMTDKQKTKYIMEGK